MKISRTVVGVDTAKRVFQLYWVDMETGEIVDLRLTRTKFLEHFANRAPCLVALEACGGSQHWGRRLRELGHEVRRWPRLVGQPVGLIKVYSSRRSCRHVISSVASTGPPLPSPTRSSAEVRVTALQL